MSEVFNPDAAIHYDGSDKVVHFAEYLETRESKRLQPKSFHCGFKAFDAYVDGLATGEVIVITGHRKEGKTTFAESWLRSILHQNPLVRGVIFSYEMPPDQLLLKYRDEPGLPIYLPLTLEAANFDWLERRCLEAKFKYGAQVVLIDHLDHMVDMSIRQNMALNIGAFMRRLKFDIAMKLNIAVLLIAHQGQPKEDKEPSVDTLRGSASIGQESDATIVVMRRKNLSAVELKDFAMKAGEDKLHLVTPPALADPDDQSSCKLAIVKIDCHRRTGVWKAKKLFRKSGDFLEEI